MLLLCTVYANYHDVGERIDFLPLDLDITHPPDPQVEVIDPAASVGIRSRRGLCEEAEGIVRQAFWSFGLEWFSGGQQLLGADGVALDAAEVAATAAIGASRSFGLELAAEAGKAGGKQVSFPVVFEVQAGGDLRFVQVVSLDNLQRMFRSLVWS